MGCNASIENHSDNVQNTENKDSMEERIITKEELSQHKSNDDCWVSFKGYVYNITPYLQKHPGGIDCITFGAGDDITEAFMERHPHVDAKVVEHLKIGRLA